MTALAAGNACGLAARISHLAPSEQELVERLVARLEERASAAAEAPIDRIRRRIEAARART